MALLYDIISLSIVILLVLTLMLPKKIQYIFNGIILVVFGIMPFTYFLGRTSFDLYSFGLARYILVFIVITSGRELFKEGLKEKNVYLKIPSLSLGTLIIIITAIPLLYSFNTISFELPEYSPVIDFVLYLVSGLFLIVGVFEATELK